MRDFPSLTKKIHRAQYPAIDPTNPANSATGKVVAISGGTGGIGYFIARGFAKAGASTIILLARRQEALNEGSAKLRDEIAAAKLSTGVWTYLLDICHTDATNVVFETIRKHLDSEGKGTDLDILVTNAANILQGKTIVDFQPEAVRAAYDTNVLGNLNLVRAFLELEAPAIPITNLAGKAKDTSSALVPNREKVILDVSTGAIHLKAPGHSLYSPSKLAFTHTMAFLQMEVDKIPGAPIRVHSFNPGVLFSPGNRKFFAEDDMPWDDESLPEGFAVWLASPAAAFLKGRFVWSSWDVDELFGLKPTFEEDPNFCQMILKGL